MFRRRRPVREIEFSFDSFLDVVANVVGIILRLILVAWVGARTYKAVVPPLPPVPAISEPSPLPEPTEPRLALIERKRHEIARKAVETEREHEQRRQEALKREQEIQKELAALVGKEKVFEREKVETVKLALTGDARVKAVQMSLTDLEKRSKALLSELDKLRKEPHAIKKLRYRTPVSAPLQTEEVTFECYRGKVTVVEVGRMLDEAQREAQARIKELENRWDISDVTQPAGAFRMRFVVERERTALDGMGPPTPGAYRSGITSWEMVPISMDRGETLEAAMRPGSAFRRIIEALEQQQTAVTFWVYPDSFAIYRKLRDYLHDHDFVVAGRPLTEGNPIAGSRKGSVSRGQ